MENSELIPTTFVLITPVVTVKAVQWDGTCKHMKQIESVFPDLTTMAASYHAGRDTVGFWIIKTDKGRVRVENGDFIVQNHFDSFALLRPKQFESMYRIEKH